MTINYISWCFSYCIASVWGLLQYLISPSRWQLMLSDHKHLIYNCTSYWSYICCGDLNLRIPYILNVSIIIWWSWFPVWENIYWKSPSPQQGRGSLLHYPQCNRAFNVTTTPMQAYSAWQWVNEREETNRRRGTGNRGRRGSRKDVTQGIPPLSVCTDGTFEKITF